MISHVKDTREAVRFYRDVLGLDQDFINDGLIKGDGSRDTWTECDMRPVRPCAGPLGGGGGRRGSRVAVDDVDEAVNELPPYGR